MEKSMDYGLCWCNLQILPFCDSECQYLDNRTCSETCNTIILL